MGYPSLVMCPRCKRVRDYTLYSGQTVVTVDGMCITYKRKYAKCNTCKTRVDIPGLEDENSESLGREIEKRKAE